MTSSSEVANTQRSDLESLIIATTDQMNKTIEADELIKQIRVVMIRAYREQFDSWDEVDISNIAIKLSTLLYGLSAKIEHARMSYNHAYGYRKFKGAQEYFKLQDGTVAEKQAIVERHIKGIRDAEVYHSYVAETLRRLHDDCARLVSVLQSVLRVKEREHFNPQTT